MTRPTPLLAIRRPAAGYPAARGLVPRALIPPFLAIALFAAGALTTPAALRAQAVHMPRVAATPTLASRCTVAVRGAGDGAWRQVRAALAEPGEARWDPVLASLQDSVEQVLAEAPDRTDDRYLLAVILGGRSEVAGGRQKLEWAGAMRAEAHRVLALEPDHAGAHHLVGRLHAAVQRMGAMKRFMARTLFDGEALEGASWDSALRHLKRAEEGDPCQPEHHFELARLHEDRGEAEQAREEAHHVLELTGGRGSGAALQERALALVGRLPRPRSAGSPPDL